MKYSKPLKVYFAGTSRMRALLLILVALVVADALITKFLVVQRFGVEANPFLQSWVGEDKFLPIKLAGALLSVLLLWDIYKHNPKLSYIATACFVGVYTIIVFWNLSVLFITQM